MCMSQTTCQIHLNLTYMMFFTHYVVVYMDMHMHMHMHIHMHFLRVGQAGATKATTPVKPNHGYQLSCCTVHLALACLLIVPA